MQAGFGDAWSAHPHGTQNAFDIAGSRPWDKEGAPGHSDPVVSGGCAPAGSSPGSTNAWVSTCLDESHNINLTFQIVLYLPDPHGQRNGIVIHLEIDKGDSFIKPVVCFRLSKVRKLRSSLIYSRSGRAYLHKTKNGKEERKKERKKENGIELLYLKQTSKQKRLRSHLNKARPK